MAIPLFYQHSSSTMVHLLSLTMIDEDFYPYIFTETLYVIPSKGGQKAAVSENKPVIEESTPVQTTAPKPVLETKAPDRTPLKVLQAGNSSVLSVVFWGTSLQFSAADKELLDKILQACKLNPADIGLFHADSSAGLLFTDDIAASKAIVFCSKDALSSAKQAKINLYTNHVLSGKTLLLSEPLSELAQNNTLKGNLWKSLQALLGL
jgi:hypothetical protein